MRRYSRRTLLTIGGAVCAALTTNFARAASAQSLGFSEIYDSIGPQGLRYSQKLLSLRGLSVAMSGFMAPPLKAESQFFVLTSAPVQLCPFCSADADWPSDIVVVYLSAATTPTRFTQALSVTGTLEIGSWTDPDNGFVSQIRLRDAAFRLA